MQERVKKWKSLYKDIEPRGSIILRNLLKGIAGSKYEDQKEMKRLVRRAVEDHQEYILDNYRDLICASQAQFDFFKFMIGRLKASGKKLINNDFMDYIRKKFSKKYSRKYGKELGSGDVVPRFNELNVFYVILHDKEMENLKKIKEKERKEERRRVEKKDRKREEEIPEVSSDSPRVKRKVDKRRKKKIMNFSQMNIPSGSFNVKIVKRRTRIKPTQELKKSKKILKKKKEKKRNGAMDEEDYNVPNRTSSKNYNLDIIQESPLAKETQIERKKVKKKIVMNNNLRKSLVTIQRNTRKNPNGAIGGDDSISEISDIESEGEEYRRNMDNMIKKRRRTFENDLLTIKNINYFLRESSLEKESIVNSFIDYSDNILEFRIHNTTIQKRKNGIQFFSIELIFLKEKKQNKKKYFENHSYTKIHGRLDYSPYFDYQKGDTMILYDPVMVEIPRKNYLLVYIQIYNKKNS